MATASLHGLQAFIAEIGLEPIPQFEAADILHNPVDIYHSYLAEHLQALVECDPNLVYASIQPSNTIENGDLDIVLPKLRLKLEGVKPKELASELLKKFQPHALFQVPFKDGIHIRFQFATKIFPRLLLPYINDRKATYGDFPSLGLRAVPDSGGKRVIVEFSSPNIAREFTAAHLRSTILGAFIANIHEAMGWTVVRVNYFGDWGKNLGLLGVGWQKYGSTETLQDTSGLFRYIHGLYSKMEDELQPEQDARKQARDEGQDASVLESQGLFAERDAYFKRMEDGEPEAIALWDKFRAISIDYYAEMYARLNVKFDEYSGESRVSLNSEAIAEVESLLKEKDISEEQNGALVIDFDKHGGKGIAALRDRNGSSTYLLRDIATVLERLKSHAFDKLIYVVCEQDVHFRQVIKTIELIGLGDVASKLHHFTFARAHTSLASQLETTSTLLLGDILDHCEKTMHEAVIASPDQYPHDSEEGDVTVLAKVMGINSMILHDLSLSLRKGQGNGLDFNLLTLTEEETGTGLQLFYTRLCAALAALGKPSSPEEISQIDFAAFSEPPWSEVLRLLIRYPDATVAAFEKQDPGPILTYLFRLAEEVSYCLDEASEGESDGAGESSAAALQYAARSVLYDSVRQVLENGMKLLGATPTSR